jgi:hypothetical protein
VYIKLVVLLRNYVTMMHGQQNIKNGWATIVVVGRLRVKEVHKRFLGAFANLHEPTISFVMPVCLSVRMEKLSPRLIDFHETW